MRRRFDEDEKDARRDRRRQAAEAGVPAGK
jgi:hypothetical protein